LQYHQKIYSKRSEERNKESLYDITALGYSALAINYGLKIRTDNIYLPISLIEIGGEKK